MGLSRSQAIIVVVFIIFTDVINGVMIGIGTVRGLCVEEDGDKKMESPAIQQTAQQRTLNPASGTKLMLH